MRPRHPAKRRGSAAASFAAALACVAALALPAAAAAQVRLDAQGAWLTRQDGSARWSGAGGGAALEVWRGRWRLSGSFLAGSVPTASLPNAATSSISLTTADVAVSLRLRPLLWLEAGATSEEVSPTLAARNVGGVWLGARIEGEVGAGMRAWVAAQAYPVSSANSGTAAGSSSVPFGAGFGTSLALGTRFRLRAEYGLRRMDRFTVQSSRATVGIGLTL